MTGRTRHELAEHEWRMERFVAESVDCPRCGALGRDEERDMPARHCWNQIIGGELQAPAHDARIREARRPTT
jgi:hypothetical protein